MTHQIDTSACEAVASRQLIDRLVDLIHLASEVGDPLTCSLMQMALLNELQTTKAGMADLDRFAVNNRRGMN